MSLLCLRKGTRRRIRHVLLFVYGSYLHDLIVDAILGTFL
jgi:hypothetical protein